MAKFKAAGSKKGPSKSKKAASRGGLIPCAIIILIGFGIIFVLFYYSLK